MHSLKRNVIIPVTISLVLLTGCANQALAQFQSRYTHIKPNMTKEEMVGYLGHPHNSSFYKNKEVIQYCNVDAPQLNIGQLIMGAQLMGAMSYSHNPYERNQARQHIAQRYNQQQLVMRHYHSFVFEDNVLVGMLKESNQGAASCHPFPDIKY